MAGIGYGYGGGLSGGVGGAAAAGIESGFNLGLRSDQLAEEKRRNAAIESRQAGLDAQQTAQIQRTNARQDKADAQSDDDRAYQSVNTELSDHMLGMAGLAQQYGGIDKIPQDVAQQQIATTNAIVSRRTALLQQRYAPIVQKEQQWARDTASQIAAGQKSMDDLTPAETVRFMQANTKRPVTDFLAPDGGKSVVRQGIDNVTAGMQTNNQSLTIDGVNSLAGPEINRGVGQVAPDGSIITNKSIHALLPAPAAPGSGPNPVQGLSAVLNSATTPPQPPSGAETSPVASGGVGPMGQPPAPPPAPALQAGQDPNKVIPVLQVTATHPDGTEVSYHAPMTQGRNTDPNAPISPPINVSDAMNHMGALGTLEAWANTPQARAKIQQGLKELGGDQNTFLGAYYAGHGDPSKLPGYEKSGTQAEINAVQKLADEQYGGDFSQAMMAFRGKAEPTSKAPSGYQFNADGKTLSFIPGGPADPKIAGERAKPPANFEWNPDVPGSIRPIKGGPADPEEMAKKPMGSRELTFVNRGVVAASEAAADLANVARMPISATTGLFGGRKQGPGLFDAGKEALANTITSQEAQTYNVRSAGFQRSLAAIEASGLAPSGTLTHQMDQVIFKAGDSYMTKLEKLAQTRQIVEAGMEPFVDDPRVPASTRSSISKALDKVRAAVPYTQEDIDKLGSLQEINPDATLRDVIKQHGLDRAKAAPAGAPPAGGGIAGPPDTTGALPITPDRAGSTLTPGELPAAGADARTARVPPAAQAARDSDMMSILQNQRARMVTEGASAPDMAAMDREIARAGGKPPARGIGAPAAQPAAPAAGPAASAPRAGTVMQGYRFKGGDPGVKTNWERVQ